VEQSGGAAENLGDVNPKGPANAFLKLISTLVALVDTAHKAIVLIA
jgi:hypothetical protein